MESKKLHEVIKDHIRAYVNYHHIDRPVIPNPEGKLQQLCNGLKDGLNIIGGRSGMGCSTFALSLATELADPTKRVPILYCHFNHSQEVMPLFFRHFNSLCDWDFPRKTTREQLDSFYNPAMAKVEGMTFNVMSFYHDMELSAFKYKLWEYIRDNRTKYIFIDSVNDFIIDHRLTDGLSNEEYICRELREEVEGLDTSIVAIANLNLSGMYAREEDISRMCSFKGGDLAAYASNVYLINRPAFYADYDLNKKELNNDKSFYVHVLGRPNVAPKIVELEFDGEAGRVYDPEYPYWYLSEKRPQSQDADNSSGKNDDLPF